jgi:D-psicose/D-tagatose/L-ribulose 3-epimerase
MAGLRYAVHAYAWTTSWSNNTLDLIDRAKRLGFDAIEVPLMELGNVDPPRIRERAEAAGLGVCTSTALAREHDITSEDEATRKRGLQYLEDCVNKTAAMGGSLFTGVVYSAIGRRIDSMPDERYWDWSAQALRGAARLGQEVGVSIGIEPINRYETFLINTCEQALRLREMIGEPNVGIHLDAYHMNVEENDFYHPTKAAAPHLCHFHLSESHRGIPGTGTVDWDGIFRALGEAGYAGLVGLESFVEVSEAMREATCVWRRMAPSSDELLKRGLEFLRGLEAKYMRI